MKKKISLPVLHLKIDSLIDHKPQESASNSDVEVSVECP